jgi:hypothetical protein
MTSAELSTENSCLMQIIDEMKDSFKQLFRVKKNQAETPPTPNAIPSEYSKLDNDQASMLQIDSGSTNEEEFEWCNSRVKELEDVERRLQDMSRRISLLQEENAELRLKPDELSVLAAVLSEVDSLSAEGMS